MPDFVSIIKQAAVEAVNASDPTEILFGTVTSTNPLSVNIGQKIPIPGSMLILTNNVRDYTVEVTTDWDTELAGDVSHSHGIVGNKTLTIRNGLKTGDKVILLQVQGGQRYIILDRMVDR